MTSSKIKVNKKVFNGEKDFVTFGRGCATPKPNNYQISRADSKVRETLISSRVDIASITKIRINIQFIHITDGTNGQIIEKQRVQQVEVLNRAFNRAGVIFLYNPTTVKYFDDRTWYIMDHGSAEEREVKTFLHTTPERNLNFYTAGLAGGLLGWATFPYEMAGDRIRDGVVILDASLPGGSEERFNLGITAVHEVGHWLGLYHTFQGGCDAVGDHVGDTIAHAEPNHGSPADGQRNGACNPEEFAPIHNYMNYCDDIKLTEFTDGQINRIKMQVVTYRKELIQS